MFRTVLWLSFASLVTTTSACDGSLGRFFPSSSDAAKPVTPETAAPETAAPETAAPPTASRETPPIAQVDAAAAAAASSAPTATKSFDFKAPTAADGPTVCGFPGSPFPANTKLFAAGAYGGRKLGYQIDQSGSEATQIDVAVNHIGAPVVLMLGSYEPTVWNIGWSSGTQLLAVLVSGYHRQVVTGLPANVPMLLSTYDNKGACGYFYVTAENAAGLNVTARRVFARPIDMVYPARQGRVVIGDALGASTALVTDQTAKDAQSFRTPDSQLAGEAGLQYAVQQGWLRTATSADADAWLAARSARASADIPPIAGGRPAGRISMHNGYVVLKAFALPAGLYGAHSATFFVPRGVSRPTGNPGHSRIYDFNTLGCTGATCNLD